jgi:hypothetical protein
MQVMRRIVHLYFIVSTGKNQKRNRQRKQSKSAGGIMPGAFYCQLSDVLDSDEYIPAGYN